ncbi:hypothetical protein MUY27_08040 [Mucilaginibacter sp. RS28]|uniref:Uncharacterized protein n=1 Tax=Mucilaginibacter straminoryzae TaxID=2932774 RepID=A0A9X2B9E0_9SPHI|nr:hypothetical protein [Mucilaginibacter straminoryzae]MCJ8209655.1 hypothetical protein [Mucilaginibacter straminoryzae]
MKNLILLLAGVLLAAIAFAQNKNYDSVAYEQQRTKIKNLLAQRSQKFGQYDASLNMHTGIFGLQTKKDIRRSNEILMDIAHTDDVIFNELKVLLSFRNNQLDLRTLQQQQAQSRAKEVESMTYNFAQTINKLRDKNDRLKKQLTEAQKPVSASNAPLIVLIVLMAASILFLGMQNARLKRKKA